MNGIENIIKRIEKDTETKAADIISRARVDAAEIAKEYEEKCKEIEAAGKERAEKAAQDRISPGDGQINRRRAFGIGGFQYIIQAGFAAAETHGFEFFDDANAFGRMDNRIIRQKKRLCVI